MSEGQGPVPRAFRSGFGRCFLQRSEAEAAARPVDGLFIPAKIRQAESERKLAGWLCGIWTLLASAVWWFTGNEGSGMHMALRGLLFPLVWFVLLQLSILSCSLLAVPPYLLGWIRSKTAALVARVCQIWPITASPGRMNCWLSLPVLQNTALRRNSATLRRRQPVAMRSAWRTALLPSLPAHTSRAYGRALICSSSS